MNWILFLTALIAVESGGDKMAVGDKRLADHAYGVCQIRQPYLDDVNKIAGTSYTLDQVRLNPELSKWCVKTYVGHYGARYTRLTGKPLTLEVAARIHNGGPEGWKRKNTDPHWAKVKKELARRQR